MDEIGDDEEEEEAEEEGGPSITPKEKKMKKNPLVDSHFLSDVDRDLQEQQLREQVRMHHCACRSCLRGCNTCVQANL